MQKNSENLTMEDAMKLAKSPAGKQLFSLLNQTDSNAVSQAMKQAREGDYSAAGQSLNALLKNPDVQKLLKELGG